MEEWLRTRRSYTLHRAVTKRFPRRPVLVRGPFHQYQADLIDYVPLSRYNDGNKYLLNLIDCFSRFACLVPLKSKSGVNVARALGKAFNFMRPPRKLQTDLGTEFYNKHVKALLSSHQIMHFSTDQELKAQIAERFNRTVRDKIKKYMTFHRHLRYVDMLPDFLRAYNAEPHSSFEDKYAPKDIDDRNRDAVHELLYGDYLRAKRRRHKYAVGDKVRLAKYNCSFARNDATNFTEELFQIVDTLDTYPPTYRVLDLSDRTVIKGAFYERQLQPHVGAS